MSRLVFLKYLKVIFLGASTVCNIEAGSSAEKFCCQCMLPRLVVGLPASSFEGRGFPGRTNVDVI